MKNKLALGLAVLILFMGYSPSYGSNQSIGYSTRTIKTKTGSKKVNVVTVDLNNKNLEVEVEVVTANNLVKGGEEYFFPGRSRG